MPRIRFQAFALRVVPQFQRVVKCSGQNVFAIRRELDKRDGRIVVVDERLQTLTTGRVPNTAQTVVAGRHDQRSIAVEMYSAHRIRVGGQRLQAFACKSKHTHTHTQ